MYVRDKAIALFSLCCRKCGFLLILGERAFADQVAPGDAVMPLRRREPQRVAGLGDAAARASHGSAAARSGKHQIRRRRRARPRARPKPSGRVMQSAA